jgi:hypothetical protein
MERSHFDCCLDGYGEPLEPMRAIWANAGDSRPLRWQMERSGTAMFRRDRWISVGI